MYLCKEGWFENYVIIREVFFGIYQHVPKEGEGAKKLQHFALHSLWTVLQGRSKQFSKLVFYLKMIFVLVMTIIYLVVSKKVTKSGS